MITKVHTANTVGIDAVETTVEVQMTPGIGIHLVGLADQYVKESLLRVTTALNSLGYTVPGKKIVINIAPTMYGKQTASLDLPIAIGILAESGQCPATNLDKYIITGELALDGTVRKTRGVLSITELAKNTGRLCIAPRESALGCEPFFPESFYAVSHLNEVLKILRSEEDCNYLLAENIETESQELVYYDYFRHSKFSHSQKAIETALAGGHNIFLVGDNSLEFNALILGAESIRPRMTKDEALETAKIFSADSRINLTSFKKTFRWLSLPVIPITSIVGTQFYLGEASLAHNGILVQEQIDLAPDNVKRTLASLLNDKCITTREAGHKVTWPAAFQLIATANSIPADEEKRKNYLKALSAPLMEHIDIQMDVDNDSFTEPADYNTNIRRRIEKARQIQRKRFENEKISYNAEMDFDLVQKYCLTDENIFNIFQTLAADKTIGLNGAVKILRVARTIADLEGSKNITQRHIDQAGGYRFLDKLQNA